MTKIYGQVIKNIDTPVQKCDFHACKNGNFNGCKNDNFVAKNF